MTMLNLKRKKNNTKNVFVRIDKQRRKEMFFYVTEFIKKGLCVLGDKIKKHWPLFRLSSNVFF